MPASSGEGADLLLELDDTEVPAESLVVAPPLLEDDADVVEGFGLDGPHLELAPDRERTLEVLQRLVVLPDLLVGVADVVEDLGGPGLLVQLLVQRKRPGVVVARLQVVPELAVDVADAVEVVRDADLASEGLLETERLEVVFERLLVVAEGVEEDAEVVVGRGHPLGVAEVAKDRESALDRVDRGPQPAQLGEEHSAVAESPRLFRPIAQAGEELGGPPHVRKTVGASFEDEEGEAEVLVGERLPADVAMPFGQDERALAELRRPLRVRRARRAPSSLRMPIWSFSEAVARRCSRAATGVSTGAAPAALATPASQISPTAHQDVRHAPLFAITAPFRMRPWSAVASVISARRQMARWVWSIPSRVSAATGTMMSQGRGSRYSAQR